MDFNVQIKQLEESEIFYVTFYHLLTSEQLTTFDKALLINRFFVLDGVNVCIRQINNIDESETEKFFKERVILSEVFNTFLKCMLLVPDDSMKKECYNIVFGANCRLELSSSVENTKTETIIMYILVNYVGYKWKTPNFKKNEVLCGLSLVLASRKARELTEFPAFESLLTTLFTSTFVDISIRGNSLLQRASKSLLTMNSRAHTSIKYIKWWKATAIPKQFELDEAVKALLSQDNGRQSCGFETDDLHIFDRSLLVKILLSSRSTLIEKRNAKQILCTAPGLFPNDCRKMLRTLKKLCATYYEGSPNESTISSIIEVLEKSVRYSLDYKFVKETSLAMIQIFKKPSVSKELKLAAVQMTKTFMSKRQ